MPVTETPHTIATLTRPADVRDSEWAGGRWITTFVCVGDRVWLLTRGPRSQWRVMTQVEAREEWKSLRAKGYERSDRHTVDVVAFAHYSEDQKFVINDDWNCYSAGVAAAAICPVLRNKGSWSIVRDVTCTEVGRGSGHRVGDRSIETTSIYGYELTTAIMTGRNYYRCEFEGVSDEVLVERQHANGCYYVAA